MPAGFWARALKDNKKNTDSNKATHAPDITNITC